MPINIPESLGIIAGKGVYPLELAESARRAGVKRVWAIAFRRETMRAIEKKADHVEWVHLGQFGKVHEALRASGVKDVVMAGQLTPTSLFNIRFDSATWALVAQLKERNAHTLFGKACEVLAADGIHVRPASSFMEDRMPTPGLIGTRPPTEQEAADICLGTQVAKATSGLEIGQTVVIKQGTILAVEAFEGTDETILRAGRLSRGGLVVVKAAKPGHDMRFDIPVVGMRTFKVLRKAGVSVLAVEAGRTILLERDALVNESNRYGICFTSVAMEDAPASGQQKDDV